MKKLLMHFLGILTVLVLFTNFSVLNKMDEEFVDNIKSKRLPAGDESRMLPIDTTTVHDFRRMYKNNIQKHFIEKYNHSMDHLIISADLLKELIKDNNDFAWLRIKIVQIEQKNAPTKYKHLDSYQDELYLFYTLVDEYDEPVTDHYDLNKTCTKLQIIDSYTFGWHNNHFNINGLSEVMYRSRNPNTEAIFVPKSELLQFLEASNACNTTNTKFSFIKISFCQVDTNSVIFNDQTSDIYIRLNTHHKQLSLLFDGLDQDEQKLKDSHGNYLPTYDINNICPPPGNCNIR